MDKDTLMVEREGHVVRITVVTTDDYAAMQLYDEVNEAARYGEIVLGVTLLGDGDDDPPPGDGESCNSQPFPAGGPRK